jgi:hypothetical protein
LLTKPLVFSGKCLSVNYSTSAVGSMRVELQTPDGQPVEGYTLENCPPVIGDRIDQPVRWDHGTDVSRLAGTPIRIRVVLHDADLYAFQFTTNDAKPE